MSIAALITDGIGPGATIPLLLTEGLGIGTPVVSTFDHGGIRGLSKKELRREKRALQALERKRQGEWEALNADRAGLRSGIRELLSPTPKAPEPEPVPVVVESAIQPRPQIQPVKPIFTEDDEDEREVEMILLSL